MSKNQLLNFMKNDVHSLSRRRFLMKGALMPLIPMSAILPGAIPMHVAASSGLTTLLILNNGTRFNGLGEDRLLTMQHLGDGYRIYNPTLMRFQAMDSLAPFNEGGFHSYAYVSNDPVNQIDPSGHIGIMAIIGFIGLGLVVLGAALTITSNVVANNHRNYAESIKPEWSWEYDWSEYDSSMKAADDWGVASIAGKVTAAVGGIVVMVAGGAAAKSAGKGIKKGVSKIFKKTKKRTSRTSSAALKRANSFNGFDAQRGRTKRSNSMFELRDVPNPTKSSSSFNSSGVGSSIF